MTPAEALRRQIELYRKMTGEERVKIALDMHAADCEAARADIRRRYPDADEVEVDRQLRRRIAIANSGDKMSPWETRRANQDIRERTGRGRLAGPDPCHRCFPWLEIRPVVFGNRAKTTALQAQETGAKSLDA